MFLVDQSFTEWSILNFLLFAAERKDMTLASPDVPEQTQRPSESVNINQDQSTSMSAGRGSALTEETPDVLHQTGGLLQTGCTTLRNRKYQHQVGSPLVDVSTPATGSDPMRGESSAAAATIQRQVTPPLADVTTPSMPAEPMKPSTSQQAFCRFRTMFVLLVGFLVRVAFMYDVGQLYVQVSWLSKLCTGYFCINRYITHNWCHDVHYGSEQLCGIFILLYLKNFNIDYLKNNVLLVRNDSQLLSAVLLRNGLFLLFAAFYADRFLSWSEFVENVHRDVNANTVRKMSYTLFSSFLWHQSDLFTRQH